MWQALRQNEIRRVLLALNNDAAGKSATERISAELIAEGYEVFQVRFPGNMDASSSMLSLRGTGRSLANGVHEALWIGKGKRPGVPSSVEAAKEKSSSKPDDALETIATTASAAEKASSLAAEIPGVVVAKEPAKEAASDAAADPPATPIASPMPAAPSKQLDAEVTAGGIVIEISNRVYRIGGLEKNAAYDTMKLNVMVRRDDAQRFFVDTFDLCSARVRSVFAKEVARELGFDVEVIHRDLGRVLLKLETIQEKHLEELQPKDKPVEIDEELMNRCIVLTVDENREQTRAIHDQQRANETLDGLLTGKRGVSVRKLQQNSQRLLRSLSVVNPFAKELRFIDDQARRRRDHMKYLSLIRSIALLHQHQRDVKTARTDDGESVEYIEVTWADIALANRLSDQVLGKSIEELSPQTRRLLIELHELVRNECDAQELEQAEYRFTRRFIRERLGWGQTQIKLHVDRLIEMEYVLAHRASGRRVEYELLYDGRGREGQPTMCGLSDVTTLTDSATTTNQSSGSDRPDIGPSSEPSSNGKPGKSELPMS